MFGLFLHPSLIPLAVKVGLLRLRGWQVMRKLSGYGSELTRLGRELKCLESTLPSSVEAKNLGECVAELEKLKEILEALAGLKKRGDRLSEEISGLHKNALELIERLDALKARHQLSQKSLSGGNYGKA
ncbi:MAG: hypothetical protein QXH00_06440 [Candidatus Jordarchaeales archaeon]